MAFFLAAGEAFGWGIVTSTNPCPMATNVAAVSFLGRKVGSPRQVVLGGLLYALGRSLTYTVLAVVLVSSIQASPLSDFLQTRMLQILGPVLIVVALFLLEMIPLSFSGPGVSEKMQKRMEAWGVWGALFLGILFALSFCPVSAGYFFVTLFRLVAVYQSRIVLPALYGIGTALPVVAFAVLIAFSARSVGRAFNVVTKIERWARRIAGVIFLALGIYFSLVHCFGMTWLTRPA
ncbi:MAG: hypothetical protein A2V98_06990 [Planctomycetes bacterium RBG_16_64_12]|nr:MAG: hypothetical protein A2V98_06990 [Planctomycetes bacterium RBG_16_64_12]